MPAPYAHEQARIDNWTYWTSDEHSTDDCKKLTHFFVCDLTADLHEFDFSPYDTMTVDDCKRAIDLMFPTRPTGMIRPWDSKSLHGFWAIEFEIPRLRSLVGEPLAA